MPVTGIEVLVELDVLVVVEVLVDVVYTMPFTTVTADGFIKYSKIVLLSPAYDAVTATSPTVLPYIALYALPFVSVSVYAVESLYALLFDLKLMVAPARGVPDNLTTALSGSLVLFAIS